MLLIPSNLFRDADPPPISKRTCPGVLDGDTFDVDSNECSSFLGWAAGSNRELIGAPRLSLTVTLPGLGLLELLGGARYSVSNGLLGGKGDRIMGFSMGDMSYPPRGDPSM